MVAAFNLFIRIATAWALPPLVLDDGGNESFKLMDVWARIARVTRTAATGTCPTVTAWTEAFGDIVATT